MAIMNFKDNKLTPELKEQLIQGAKVEFKWYGSDSLYIGRIEMRDGRHYFVNENCYENDILVQKGMKYYNPLDTFHCFSHFRILNKFEWVITLQDKTGPILDRLAKKLELKGIGVFQDTPDWLKRI